MNVQLLYRVPVAVVVDTASGTVARVVVLDEEIALDETADVWDHDQSRPLPDDHPLISVAGDIAADAGWPAWEAGW